MATRRITIPPGQEVRISLPGGETIVLACGDAAAADNGSNLNNNNNSSSNDSDSNNSSGSELPESFVRAALGSATGFKRLRPGQKGGKKTRKAGKRGPNGYMKFAAEMRPQILKENPEMKSDITQVARKIGEKWRALSAAEKAKY